MKLQPLYKNWNPISIPENPSTYAGGENFSNLIAGKTIKLHSVFTKSDEPNFQLRYMTTDGEFIDYDFDEMEIENFLSENNLI